MRISQEQKNQIIDFLRKHRGLYSKNTLQYLEDNFMNDIYRTARPCEMNQIYAHFNVFPENQNIYKFFLNHIKENHDIYSNILEIGGGCFPVFAKYVAKEQLKCKSGKITVYDPKLVTKRINHVRLIRRQFDKLVDISDYDLITAIMPCNVAELIIKQASAYHKELFLVLCEHERFDNYSYPTQADWENHIRELMYLDSNEFDITESRIPKQFGSNHLIFHKKHKKM